MRKQKEEGGRATSGSKIQNSGKIQKWRNFRFRTFLMLYRIGVIFIWGHGAVMALGTETKFAPLSQPPRVRISVLQSNLCDTKYFYKALKKISCDFLKFL